MMKTRIAIWLLTLCSCVAAATPLAVSVNLNGYAMQTTYLNGWQNRPVIDARCAAGQFGDPVACYYAQLDVAKEGCGRYISGSRVQAAIADYPPEAVLVSAMPSGSTLQVATDATLYVDIRKMPVRTAFVQAINAELSARPGTTVLVDNIVHPSAWPAWPFTWEQACDVLSRIRAPGRKIVANIAGAAWGFTDEDCKLLENSVDGMAFEMPFHSYARDDAARTRRQIEVYRRWLNAGKTIVLIPVDGSLTTDAGREAEAKYIAAFAMIVRGDGQPMYVAAPFFKPTPEWASWPESFGGKRDDYHQNGSTLVQAFRNGVLRITPPRTVVWEKRVP